MHLYFTFFPFTAKQSHKDICGNKIEEKEPTFSNFRADVNSRLWTGKCLNVAYINEK